MGIAELETLRARIAVLEVENTALQQTNVELVAGAAERHTSKEWLRHIIQSARDYAILTLDAEGAITGWNQGAANVFGWTEAEVLGRDISLIFTPEDRAALAPEEEQQGAREEGSAEDERWHVRKDGCRFWASGSIVPLRDASGRVEGYLKVCRDETKRRCAEEALRESEALKSTILETALDCIVTIDHAGCIVEWNPAAERTFNHTRAAALGQNIAELIIPPEYREAHRRGLAHYLVSGEGPMLGRRIEVEALRADGSRFPAEIAVTPTSTGSRALFTAHLRDISASRHAEAALRESEAQFRAIADNIPQMAWMARPDGSRYWFNQRWYDYTGTAPGQIDGVGWRQVHHPDHLDRVLEGMRRGWEAGEPWEDTFPLRGRDGEYRWFLTRAVPVHDAEGRVTLWFGSNTDITERQVIEAALREESRTLEVLNQTGAVLAAELDLGSIVQKVTDAATELSSAAFGAFFYKVTNEDGEALTLYSLSGASREAFAKFPLPRNTEVFGPTFRAEGILRSDDITVDPRYGRNAPYHGMPEGHLPVRSYLAVPVVSRSGEVLGGLFFGHPNPGIFTKRAERVIAGIASQAAVAIDNARLYQAAQREVAARKAAEDSLRQLNETLERLVEERTAALLREVEERRKAEEALRQGEKLQAIGQLTGGIAHDFNNILQVVASGAALLKMPSLTEERRVTVLEGLSKAAENARELTGRLLAFARKKSLQPEVFDLNARLADMSELLRQTLGSRIRVETDFAPDLWPAIVDPSQFEVSILNLAVNARDAMLPDGGVLTLQTRSARLEATSERAAGEYVRVVVKDTGGGMPPAVLARVFEPFFTTKGLDKGTGLGLAQVHGFAKQSGGDIAIESASGEGTTVTVHLPRATTTAQRDAPQARARESEGATLQRTAGRTVLVVEDNPDVASFAASMLEGLGYTTRRAANAAEALALIDSGERVDAVFSDVVMPGPMNGVQLASALRLSHPHLPIVLATGYSEVLAEWNGRAVAEVLGKPYRLDELASALERALAAV
jgi:PAS domain S-box-containing protein